MEDTNKPANGQTPAPAANGANNQNPNPAGGSGGQGGDPQTVPYSRFKEVNDELKALKEKPAEKPTQPLQVSDADWKRKVEVEISVPDYLKGKEDDMADFWGKNPNLSKKEVFKIFTPEETLADMVNKSKEAANNSRTGGTSNPAARQENQDTSKMSREDLRKELETRIAAGERF